MRKRALRKMSIGRMKRVLQCDEISLQNYDWKVLSNQILLAANASLRKKTPQQRRNYISRKTWNLIQERQNEHQNGDSQAVDPLNNEIRRGAKKDRKDAHLNSLRELPDAGENWQGVKELKRDPAPKFVRLRNLQGQLVAPKDRAETIAEYLSLSIGTIPCTKSYNETLPCTLCKMHSALMNSIWPNIMLHSNPEQKTSKEDRTGL